MTFSLRYLHVSIFPCQVIFPRKWHDGADPPSHRILATQLTLAFHVHAVAVPAGGGDGSAEAASLRTSYGGGGGGGGASFTAASRFIGRFDLRQQLGLTFRQDDLVVVLITPAGQADKAKIPLGSRLLTVSGTAVVNVDEFTAQLESCRGGGMFAVVLEFAPPSAERAPFPM